MDVLGQIGACQCLSDTVVADVGNLAQAVEQAQGLKDTGIDADADSGVPRFDPLLCRAGREGALSHDRHRQSATPACIVNVRAELAQGALHGGRRFMWSRHMTPSHYILPQSVVRSLQFC